MTDLIGSCSKVNPHASADNEEQYTQSLSGGMYKPSLWAVQNAHEDRAHDQE